MKQRSLYEFRDWLFNLLIDYLVNSNWIIVVKDFKKSDKKSERKYLGLTDYGEQIIYLDKYCGACGARGLPRILVHEICHFAFGVILEKMAINLPPKRLKNVKVKSRAKKQFRWEELRTQEFEKLFYNSLNKKQIKTLQDFIDEAMERYTEDEG